ncbi:MAG TPA: hypothetical protein VK446_06805 [Methylocystis sp.]|nr:hypothetical protein [Methylocystis sp.]
MDQSRTYWIGASASVITILSALVFVVSLTIMFVHADAARGVNAADAESLRQDIPGMFLAATVGFVVSFITFSISGLIAALAILFGWRLDRR